MFERIDLQRDLHFYTKTTVDTLDYSGSAINEGSKLVVAAYGEKIRNLSSVIPALIYDCSLVSGIVLPLNGVLALQLNPFTSYSQAGIEIQKLSAWIAANIKDFDGIVQVVLYDDFTFAGPSTHLNDYVWITYTRSDPANDIYGVNEFTENKHWGCKGPMIIDARKKPHHAPELRVLPETEKSIERFFKKGAVLEKWA